MVWSQEVGLGAGRGLCALMLYRGVVRGTNHPCLPRMSGSWNQVDLPELPTPGASSHMDSS